MQILCLFGIASSGKTTLGRELAKKINGSTFIDAEVFRMLFGNESYTYEGRRENLCHLAEFCSKVKGTGTLILAFNAPTKEYRDFFPKDVVFIHCDCDLKTAMDRDSKGFYARAEEGETGIRLPMVSEPFDTEGAHITIDTTQAIGDCVTQVVEYIEDKWSDDFFYPLI